VTLITDVSSRDLQMAWQVTRALGNRCTKFDLSFVITSPNGMTDRKEHVALLTFLLHLLAM